MIFYPSECGCARRLRKGCRFLAASSKEYLLGPTLADLGSSPVAASSWNAKGLFSSPTTPNTSDEEGPVLSRGGELKVKTLHQVMRKRDHPRTSS